MNVSLTGGSLCDSTSVRSTVADALSSYGRIETLSGFANGLFLILISIFIVFEAIQRMYVSAFSVTSSPIHISRRPSANPPEMETNQLLLVSTMGLVVNLFGLFAMGGHHHHHHHGHGHGHSHSDLNHVSIKIHYLTFLLTSLIDPT